MMTVSCMFQTRKIKEARELVQGKVLVGCEDQRRGGLRSLDLLHQKGGKHPKTRSPCDWCRVSSWASRGHRHLCRHCSM